MVGTTASNTSLPQLVLLVASCVGTTQLATQLATLPQLVLFVALCVGIMTLPYHSMLVPCAGAQ